MVRPGLQARNSGVLPGLFRYYYSCPNAEVEVFGFSSMVMDESTTILHTVRYITST